MRQEQPNRAGPQDSQSTDHTRPANPGEAGADIHLRNYDHEWGYDLDVEVVADDDEPVFAKRYYLQPGRVECEIETLPAGRVEVRATLDNRQRVTRRCRVGPGLDQTVVIEVGNGALSLTQGHPR